MYALERDKVGLWILKSLQFGQMWLSLIEDYTMKYSWSYINFEYCLPMQIYYKSMKKMEEKFHALKELITWQQRRNSWTHNNQMDQTGTKENKMNPNGGEVDMKHLEMCKRLINIWSCGQIVFKEKNNLF